MSDSLFKREYVNKMVEDVTSGKVFLNCGIHNWYYGMKRNGNPVPPNFQCARCQMVSFMGLIVNTPPEKREQTVEALEEFTHHLMEAEKRGEIDLKKLLARPEVSIERGVN